MSREVSPRPPNLLPWLVGIALALLAIDLVLWLVWGPGKVAAVLPWLAAVVDGFFVVNSLAIAFVAFRRVRAQPDPAPFWVGAAFVWLAIFAVFHLLAVPSLLPDDRAILGRRVEDYSGP